MLPLLESDSITLETLIQANNDTCKIVFSFFKVFFKVREMVSFGSPVGFGPVSFGGPKYLDSIDI